LWDFGDGSTAGTGQLTTHQYQSNGLFTITLTVFGSCDTSQTQDTILVQGINVDEYTQDNHIVLYPNPTSNFTHLQVQSNKEYTLTLNIVDPIGKIVYSDIFKLSIGINNLDIDMSLLKPGTYLLRIDGPEVTTALKIVRL
jgi:PKD repeat protein